MRIMLAAACVAALVLGACGGGEKPTAIYELTTVQGRPVPGLVFATPLDSQWVVAGEIRVLGNRATWRQENRYDPPAYGGVTDQVSSTTYDWQVHEDSVQMWPHCPIGVDCFGFVGTLAGPVLSLSPGLGLRGGPPLEEFRRIFPP